MTILNILYITFKVCWTLLFWPVVIIVAISVAGGLITLSFGGMLKAFSYLSFKLTGAHKEHNNNNSSENASDCKNQSDGSSNRVSPYTILGIEKGASMYELKKAYKNKIMVNHPDKLASLDPELRQIATERTIRIKEAYQLLVG